MLFTSPIISRGSGSLAGITMSHNRGGNFMRARNTPTNPNTPQQQTVRSYFAQLAAIWSSVLTQAQRAAWDLYAENVHLPNPLGEFRNVGGMGMFQRCNVPRLASGVADFVRVDVAPGIFDLGDYTTPTVDSASESADTVTIGWEGTDPWADEDASGMLIYLSRPQNPGINFFKGPYRFAAAVEGDSATPPTSPEVVDAPFPFVAGQRVFVFIRVTRVDGRLSASFRGTVLGT